MEHRLVLGGEQFLPFARSRIRALRALGLPYADQSFEIDGVSIKVRIEPGHEYIRIEGNPAAYLESGQHEWSFPGELNPEKYDPAKWHFLDIPVTDKYLGWAASGGKKSGEQKEGQVLTEGMESQALGYPVKPGLTAEQIAELKEAYGNQTVLAKLTRGYYPPSLFSGKMRLFMQAKYGALAEKDYSPFAIEVAGLSAVLFYYDKKGNRLQFGIWDSATPGIYTAPDNKGYWLINFRSETTESYKVTAYPLRLSAATNGMRARLKDPSLSDDERTQCEAYVLGNADIDLNNGKVIGTVTREEAYYAIAYGWKFSQSGHKVSVALIKAFANGSGYDTYKRAMTIHCNIGSTTNEAGETEFSFEYSVDEHGDWNYDTYAEYNIFTPEYEYVTGPLYCISREDATKMRDPFNFSDVSIYGYYVGETWTPVKIRRDIPLGPWPKYRQSWSGTVASTAFGDWNDIQNVDQYLSTLSNVPFSYEGHALTDSRSMDITVGTTTFVGTSEYGSHVWRTRSMTSGATVSVSYPSSFTAGGYPGTMPPGGDYTGNETGGSHYAVTGTTTLTLESYNGWEFNVWALVIPGRECESVIVASLKDESSTRDVTTTVGTGVFSFYGNTVDYVPGDGLGMAYSFSPWCNTRNIGGYYGVAEEFTQTTTEIDGPPYEYLVNNFSKFVPGSQGAPSGSYYTLFNVDINNPYYNGIMYSITSYGGRYAMSEGETKPSSVDYMFPFVGRA